MLAYDFAPRLEQFLRAWRRLTLIADGAVFGGGLLLFLVLTVYAGYWNGLHLRIPAWEHLDGYTSLRVILLLLLAAGAGYAHFTLRRWAVERVTARFARDAKVREFLPNYVRAFRKNTRWFRSIFRRRPAGWGRTTADHLARLVDVSLQYVQRLNDQYTNPSGEAPASAACAETESLPLPAGIPSADHR